MTTASDTLQIVRLGRIIKMLSEKLDEVRAERDEVRTERDELSDELDEALWLTPYDLPHDVLAALVEQLPGWPAARWRQLAKLITEQPP